MSNGKIGDHPLTDIFIHNVEIYSKDITNLVIRINNLGGKIFLDSIDWLGEYNQFHISKTKISKLESILKLKLDELVKEAKQKGWSL